MGKSLGEEVIYPVKFGHRVQTCPNKTQKILLVVNLQSSSKVAKKRKKTPSKQESGRNMLGPMIQLVLIGVKSNNNNNNNKNTSAHHYFVRGSPRIGMQVFT